MKIVYSTLSNICSCCIHYCKSGNFRENFIVKTYLRYLKFARQGHDLPISVNDRMISSFHDDFILTKINLRENFRICSTIQIHL